MDDGSDEEMEDRGDVSDSEANGGADVGADAAGAGGRSTGRTQQWRERERQLMAGEIGTQEEQAAARAKHAAAQEKKKKKRRRR